MSKNRPYGKFVSPEHSEAARQIAEQGIVLLKNEKQVLPVRMGKFKNIAVIGENATKSLTIGGGSSSLKVAYEISPLAGLENKFGKENINYSMGYASDQFIHGIEEPSKLNVDSLINAAVKIAKKSDIVFFIGGMNKNHFQDCEGVDRKSMSLPYSQNKLISELTKVNKNVVVVLLTGNAVEMPWLNNIQALLQGWYLGSEAGNALANILSGEVSPSGKLPFSFPKKLEDNSAHFFGTKSYPGDSLSVNYLEDILVGYRWHDTKGIAPLFPFGHGLSYSTFKYGTIQTDKKNYSTNEQIKVFFTLTNTGSVDAAESVQVYMNQKNPSLMRPVKELKGFKKVYLKPGETKTVELELLVRDFAFYNEAKQDWVVEGDEFILYNAASAEDVKSKTSIKVIL